MTGMGLNIVQAHFLFYMLKIILWFMLLSFSVMDMGQN